jgi:diguanylate cyclase (GGDEF)-like protein
MKVLVAQYEETSRKMLEATLAKWGYSVLVASDGTQAWQELQKEGAAKLAILDRTIGDMDGLQVCREVRKRPELSSTYLLLATTKGREEEMIEGLKAGADDFLEKPVRAEELMIRLRVARRIVELQEELARAHEAIGYQATHDQLTGLWNRGAILDALTRELARVRREGSPLGVILAEIDHFKKINDTYGLQAGDAVLRGAARRMRSLVRPYDLVARYGAEEFLVIVPGCDAPNALHQAERLRAALAAESYDLAEWGRYDTGKDAGLHITLSAGVAAGSRIRNAESLLRAAESALARAKQAGRDRAETASEAELKQAQ